MGKTRIKNFKVQMLKQFNGKDEKNNFTGGSHYYDSTIESI